MAATSSILQTLLQAAVSCALLCSVTCAANTCDAFVYPGSDDVNIKLAAIYGMHGSNATTCGNQPMKFSIQGGLALHWALSLLNGKNGNDSFIPGVKLGIDIYDDCNLEYLAARHAGSVASQSRGLAHCASEWDEGSSHEQAVPIAGIIGTTRSQTTTIVTKTMLTTNIPVVGISATLAELSDKSKYPGFTRTVPDDDRQVEAIIALALKLNWSYIVGIFTNDNYGLMGMTRLQALASEHRICVSVVNSLDILGTIDDEALSTFVRDTLFDKVKLSNGALWVVYFGQDDGLNYLLNRINTWVTSWTEGQSILEQIHWMVSDAVVLGSNLVNMVRDYNTRVVGLDQPTPKLESFQEFQLEFFRSPPAWAMSGLWREALEVLAREHYGCPSYNFSMESIAQCDIKVPRYYNGYMPAVVDAVYLLGNTLKTMHGELCGGQPGVCDSLRIALESGLLASHNLAQLDYTSLDLVHTPPEFARAGRVLDQQPEQTNFLVRNQSLYSIKANSLQDDQFVKIGSYTKHSVHLLPEYETVFPDATCSNVCEDCPDLDAKSYEFLDGDYVILGIFSLHWSAADASFECGAFRGRSESFPAMQAFINAVELLRVTTGIKFGYLVLDDCYSSLTINRMLSKIMSGDLTVTCKTSHVNLDIRKVVVGVGPQSSPITISVLPLLQTLNIPLISYSATNPSLDDRITYPYFSRTVFSDTQQALALSLVLEQLNVTYVGAIVFGNLYGRALYQAFRERAEARGICVANSFEVTDKTTAADVRPQLQIYRNSGVSVVVAIVMDKVVETLTEAVTEEDTFVFLGSEAWGQNLNVLEGNMGEKVRGSLVFEPNGFDWHFGGKNIVESWKWSDTETNEWLRKFWESHFDCNLPRGFNNVHPRSCTESPFFSNDDLEELEGYMVKHSTVATIAAGLAITDLLSDVTRSSDKEALDPGELSEAIRGVTLSPLDGPSFRPFNYTGNGNRGLQVYNIQQNGNSYSYEQVGTFLNDELTLDHSKLTFYDITGRTVKTVEASCQYRTECRKICFPERTDPPVTVAPDATRLVEGDKDDETDTIVIILAVVIGVLFLIIMVIIILAILTCTGYLTWSKAGKNSSTSWTLNSYDHGSSKQSYGQSGESHSSSSYTDSRPPLPLRKRRQRTSSDGVARTDISYTNRAFSDIVVIQPSDVTGERNLFKSFTLPRPANTAELQHTVQDIGPAGGSDRMTPSPHRAQSMELVGTCSSTSVIEDTDSSRIRHNQNADNVHQRIPLRPHSVPSQTQQTHLQNGPVEQQYQHLQQKQLQFGRLQQQQPRQPEHLVNSNRSSQIVQPGEALRHQQQLAILHALQQPNLDDQLRQQYLWLLYQMQRPNQHTHPPEAPGQQQPHTDPWAQQNQNQHSHNPRQQHQVQRGEQPYVVLGDTDDTVFFRNVSGASALYSTQTSPRSLMSSKDPDYIYVFTAEGLTPVPYENYARIQDAGVVEHTQGESNCPEISQSPYAPDSTVYAKVVQASAEEPPSHPYMSVEGSERYHGERSNEKLRQNDSGLNGDRLSNTHLAPLPHHRAPGVDYLTPLPESGPGQMDYDTGLVELPKEVYLSFKDMAYVEPYQGPRGENAANVNNSTLDLTRGHGTPEANLQQTRTATYTVASSDYPVKTNHIRMSTVPQKAYRQPQHDANFPNKAEHFIPGGAVAQELNPARLLIPPKNSGTYVQPSVVDSSVSTNKHPTEATENDNPGLNMSLEKLKLPSESHSTQDSFPVSQTPRQVPSTGMPPDPSDISDTRTPTVLPDSNCSNNNNLHELYQSPPNRDPHVPTGLPPASMTAAALAAEESGDQADSKIPKETNSSDNNINSRARVGGHNIKHVHGVASAISNHPDILDNLTESEL